MQLSSTLCRSPKESCRYTLCIFLIQIFLMGICHISSLASQTHKHSKRSLSLVSQKSVSPTSKLGKSSQTGKLQVVNYITWWSLDPEGYHPAILLQVENSTGHDLTGELIHFQGRFMNLQTMDITIGRNQAQRQFLPHQQMMIWLKGTEPFELPISSFQWPTLECKVMYRIGNVGDEGTQTLLITGIDKLAMTDEDAHQTLEKMPEYTQTNDKPSSISQ